VTGTSISSVLTTSSSDQSKLGHVAIVCTYTIGPWHRNGSSRGVIKHELTFLLYLSGDIDNTRCGRSQIRYCHRRQPHRRFITGKTNKNSCVIAKFFPSVSRSPVAQSKFPMLRMLFIASKIKGTSCSCEITLWIFRHHILYWKRWIARLSILHFHIRDVDDQLILQEKVRMRQNGISITLRRGMLRQRR